jgi:glycosyltransferase involved in cell wall biosynthesis
MVSSADQLAVKRPRVLIVVPDNDALETSGCLFTRSTGPAAWLREQGYPVDVMPYTLVRLSAASHEGIVSRYDVYCYPRASDMDGRFLELIKRQQAAGKVVLWESDDDYTNEYRHVVDGDAVAVMKEVTAITVSTPGLREQVQKYSDRPVYLLQNCIDLRFWDSVRRRRTVPSPSIGLVGTPTHGDDWIHAKTALFRIAAEYPSMSFVIGGFMPDYLSDLPNLHVLETVSYESYPNMVHQIDIGLAPLDMMDRFNLSKSGIKAMEYWAEGASVVASAGSVYGRVVGEDRGFLATTTDEWYTAIKTYLDNPGLREQHAQAGRQWVERKRNMAKNAILWWEVYSLAWNKYGGKIDERSFSRRSMGLRLSDSQGFSSHDIPAVQSPARRRRSRNHNRTNAARSGRYPNHGRGA